MQAYEFAKSVLKKKLESLRAAQSSSDTDSMFTLALWSGIYCMNMSNVFVICMCVNHSQAPVLCVSANHLKPVHV